MFKVKFLEEVYSVLVKYANTSAEYYDKEGFIFLFGIIPRSITPFEHILECTDGKERILYLRSGVFVMEGDGEDRVNSIIRKIIKEYEKNNKSNELDHSR
jgi:hypothetical protein